MRILVTGADGQLGQELRALVAANPDYIFTDAKDLDITSLHALHSYANGHNIKAIVNCAAYTNVERAEEEPEVAERVNAEGAHNLAIVAKECGAKLIHISTDYIFDGHDSSPIKEDATAAPLSVYGHTKWLGEEAIKVSGCDYIILRTAWLYSAYGNNFLKTMLRLSSERERLTVVSDQRGTPTYAADLATVVRQLVEDDTTATKEVYHYTNEGEASWHDFAVAIIEASGNRCTVDACSSAEYPQRAKRPAYSVLDKTKIKQRLGIEIPHWRDALQRAMQQIKR